MSAQPFDLDELLRQAVTARASDVHLHAGLPPAYRIDGHMTPVPGWPVLTDEMLAVTLPRILKDHQRSGSRRTWSWTCRTPSTPAPASA